jgi:hypothetical protein
MEVIGKDAPRTDNEIPIHALVHQSGLQERVPAFQNNFLLLPDLSSPPTYVDSEIILEVNDYRRRDRIGRVPELNLSNELN